MCEEALAEVSTPAGETEAAEGGRLAGAEQAATGWVPY